MKLYLIVPVVLLLSSCGTPRQQCINQVSRDITIVDRLIAEIERNLARGYAMVQVVVTRPDYVDCTPDPTPERPNPRPRQCLVDVAEEVSRPVAIDLNAEAAKLASLQTKRDQLALSTNAAIAACQRQYPE